MEAIKEKGKVFLFPSPISETEVERCLPLWNLELLKECDCFVVEELRTARRFLRKAGYKRDFETVEFFVLNEHTKDEEIEAFLQPLKEGRNIGVMSEAGLPCVADPGSKFVAIVQRYDFDIVPLIGPSSLMLALMGSGFNGQRFAFEGYLPAEKTAREKKIRDLENLSYRLDQTQIFIEAPYRNNHLFESILKTCKDQTLLCIASELYSPEQLIKTKTIFQWKKTKIDLNKKNTVFLLSK